MQYNINATNMLYISVKRKEENFEREKSQSAAIGTAKRKLCFIAQKSAPIVNAWLPPASSNNSKELIKIIKICNKLINYC